MGKKLSKSKMYTFEDTDKDPSFVNCKGSKVIKYVVDIDFDEVCETHIHFSKYLNYTFEEEINIQRKCAENSIGPEVYKVYKTTIDNIEFDVVEMEKYKCEIFDHLKNKTIDEQKLIIEEYFLLVCRLHNLNITHGDTHERNIMVTKDGELKFIDFGSSQRTDTDDEYYTNYKVNELRVSDYNIPQYWGTEMMFPKELHEYCEERFLEIKKEIMGEDYCE